jgi:hypothetical protein
MGSLSDKYKNNLPFDSSNVTTITSNYTALNNDVVFVNTASSALTVTLPASPTAGSKIKVLDIATNSQNNNITVLGNGNNIGGASAYIINTPDSSVEAVYINSTKGWNILNEYISISKPGIPVSLAATDVGTGREYNNGAATITFTPSTSGGPADSYTVISTPGSFSATGTSSPLLVTGLQSNTSYTFKIYATNAAGNSADSVSSSSITATTVPQAPTISTVATGFERLLVNYTANATGGKAVSAYTATRTGAVTASGNSPIAFSALTAGTSYTISMTATNDNGTSLASNSIAQTPFTASGGATATSGGYRIHTFTGSSNFVLTGNTVSCEYLVVAGGGGGGAGGGGAGGCLTGSLSTSPNTYAITVGAPGGAANSGVGGGAAGNGTASTFSSISTVGGGGGGGTGQGGGSGGGGAWSFGLGSGTPGQGFNGGAGVVGDGRGGGGGGATEVGQNASGSNAGNGGTGLTSSISGSSLVYAGGGGGGAVFNRGLGGSGGGGNGGSRSLGGSAGASNTGGGGGGNGESTGSNGGSGIVIIRYLV